MRNRYSRRIYSLENVSNISDYIDDEDLKFLENLISFHELYVENLTKKCSLDVSLLPLKFVKIYENIYKNFKITETSKQVESSTLYHNFDLNFEGEEFHRRNIREQIIHYLYSKKNQIFTIHRVEFFIQIVLNEKFKNLRNICQKVVFDLKPTKEITESHLKGTTEKSFEKELVKSKLLDYRKYVNIILKNFAMKETLLVPYIRMHCPEDDVRHELNQSDIKPFEVKSLGPNQFNQGFIKRLDENKTLIINRSFRNSDTYNNKTSTKNKQLNSPKMSDLYNSTNLSYKPKYNSSVTLLNSRNFTKFKSYMKEIIEISDEENESIENSNIKVNKLIDFLISRCTIRHDMHPTLLTENQMKIELNGFLLFVNFSIRFSLRFHLEPCNHHIFYYIFVSSLIVGLTFLISIKENQINIQHLSEIDYRIVCTRLQSLTPSSSIVTSFENGRYSVFIDSDISSLVQLGFLYVESYHETGELVEK